MKSDEKIVLGIDPGSRFTGFALLEHRNSAWRYLESGVIVLGSDAPLSERLHRLSESLQKIYDRFLPRVTVIEKVFLGKNVASAFTLGHVRGVVLLEAARYRTEVREYATRAVKKSVTGYGAADKVQVQGFLRSLFGITGFARDDASDALALALHGARDWEREQRMADRGVSL